jgi:hypothetical protein
MTDQPQDTLSPAFTQTNPRNGGITRASGPSDKLPDVIEEDEEMEGKAGEPGPDPKPEEEEEQEEPDIAEIVKPTQRLTGSISPNQPAPKARPKVMINQDAGISTIAGPLFDNIVLDEIGDDTRKDGLADSDGEAASVESYKRHSDISL